VEAAFGPGRNRYGVQGAHLNPLGSFLNPLGLFLRTSIPFRYMAYSEAECLPTRLNPHLPLAG
jgi:hypothetical protein